MKIKLRVLAFFAIAAMSTSGGNLNRSTQHMR